MSFRSEMIQIAAVAVAVVQDLDYGDTRIGDWDGGLAQVLRDVGIERHLQEDKWGAQSHSKYKWMAILTEEVGEAAMAALEEGP